LGACATWPTKPVRYVVPLRRGTTDILARLISPKLQAVSGQTFFVDNAGGAGGVLGADAVAKSPPTATPSSRHHQHAAINPALNPKMPYDAARDLVPITLIGSTPNVVMSAASPYKTMQDLLADARRNPGGSRIRRPAPARRSTWARTAQAIAKVFIVPSLPGSGPAIQDVMGGQVTMGIDTLVVAAPHIKAGTLRALASRRPGAPAASTTFRPWPSPASGLRRGLVAVRACTAGTPSEITHCSPPNSRRR